MGRVGEVVDRVVLHHIAEASVKRFIDGIIAATSERIARLAVERPER
jgi:hypothetical protein